MAKVVLLDAWSNSLLGRRAECIAMGKAMAKARICEKMISSRSMGNDWAMMRRRRLVRRVGLAQVALEDVADPDEVLLPQRLVQAELAVERGHVLRRGVGPEDGVGGVAREEVDQEEGGDRHEDDDDDEQHQPLGDVTGHGASFPPSALSIPFGSRRPPPAADDPRPRAPCPTMRPMPEEVPALTGRTRIVVGGRRGAGGRRRAAPPLLDPFGPLARRGAHRRHRPPPAARDPRSAEARRGAAALLLPAALLDRPLRAVQRRRAVPLGRVRRAHPPGRLALRAAPRAAGPWPGRCSSCWPARPSPCTTPPSPACTRWSSS